jgi:3-oxoacyl-[acyl-carrier protein] reductase
MAQLTGKVAIVTGASKGIGAGIAKGLAAAGAAVVVNYAGSKEGADAVVHEIVAKDGKAIAVQGDVAKADDVQRLFAETKRAFGAPSILVNNAGVYHFQALGEITEDQYRRQFDTNVLGVLLTAQEAAKHFEAGGSIINISSIASTNATPNTAVYSATKAAVDSVTRVLSRELGARQFASTRSAQVPRKRKGLEPSTSSSPTWANGWSPLRRSDASDNPPTSPPPPSFWRRTPAPGSPARASASPAAPTDSTQ